MKIRPCVLKFAEAMEKVLRQNDHKGDPTMVPFSTALDRMWDEIRELDRAGWGHENIATTDEQRDLIAKEAVDVANFALMAWFGIGAGDRPTKTSDQPK